MDLTPLITKLTQRLGRLYGRRANTFLNALLGAFASVLTTTAVETDNAQPQLDLLTASDSWLDQQGTLYAVPRRAPTEPDARYGPRIIQETIQQRPQRDALTAILKNAFGITVTIADLWPYVLQSDQFLTPVGRPPQENDGQWLSGFPSGFNQAALGGIAAPYLPGNFGLWVVLALTDPYSLTLAQLEALYPQFLLSDQFTVGTLMVSDDQFLSNQAEAEVSFGLPPVILPITDAELLAVVTRHRAAGTQPIIMAHLPTEASA